MSLNRTSCLINGISFIWRNVILSHVSSQWCLFQFSSLEFAPKWLIAVFFWLAKLEAGALDWFFSLPIDMMMMLWCVWLIVKVVQQRLQQVMVRVTNRGSFCSNPISTRLLILPTQQSVSQILDYVTRWLYVKYYMYERVTKLFLLWWCRYLW